MWLPREASVRVCMARPARHAMVVVLLLVLLLDLFDPCDGQVRVPGWLLMAREEIGNERFLATYGDGLAPVNLRSLIQKHEQEQRAATVTVTRPANRFGIVDLGEAGAVKSFREKPAMTDYVNMGFFVFEPSIFDLLRANESLEEGLLNRLAIGSELTANVHDGFWEPMDTYREYEHLNSLWKDGLSPWRVFGDS